ncbi:hypothetical protein C7M61_003763 [Candidozyma pseudohaemuli]|uniref:Uncharacterized protein n=1 Tax=Candidozyma pseudohaemuli TaxID=418784 RepID=A0A2P7YLS4_9ASCO|nr:hypothetical protein C7M61_003763 [[Candida] pseudohaemulonii]PSK36899.1 hypothetical protein C7M61_003763 [[Candida] pseudohaemulonii]
MRFLGRRRKLQPQPQPQPQLRKEAPREKLSTIYQLRNFGTNYKRQLDAVVEAVDKNVFLSRTVGLLLQGEHLQVTELAVKSLDMAEHPDLKIQIEYARLRNGVTAFGKGPNPGSTMLVFEVVHTYHTFDWSDLEMPMPIVGKCFLAAGDDRQLFPGPKFPMSHQLYGFGSEMKMGSIHDNVTMDGGSLELKADFKPPSWIQQEAYSRIVLPGMHVASFLPLSLQLVDEWSSNTKLQELLHLTKIRVELQEFRCVPDRNFESTDIQRKVLVEQEVFMAINLFNKKTMIPHTMYDCVIPEVGPTFFTDGFLRTYGLEVTLTISNERTLTFNASVFIELNVAQKKVEQMKDEEVRRSISSYLGDGNGEPQRIFHVMKDLRNVESTANGLLTLSGLNADEFTGKSFVRQKRSFPWRIVRFGERNIPFTLRVSLNEHVRFLQSNECSAVTIVSPGMELSEFVKCAFIVAQSFEDASRHHHVEDTEIQLEQIEIKLIEGRTESGIITTDETILLDNKDLPSIRWSDFKDTVAGSPKARSITLPQTLFKGNLPANVKPYVICQRSKFQRSHLMECRLLVRFLGQVHAFEWPHLLEVAENRM